MYISKSYPKKKSVKALGRFFENFPWAWLGCAGLLLLLYDSFPHDAYSSSLNKVLGDNTRVR